MKKIFIFSDYTEALKLVFEASSSPYHYVLLLREKGAAIQRAREVQLGRMLHEGNSCADFLAKRGTNDNIPVEEL